MFNRKLNGRTADCQQEQARTDEQMQLKESLVIFKGQRVELNEIVEKLF